MRRLFRNFQFFVQASLVIFGSPQIARAVPFDVEAAKIAGLEAKAPASGSFTEFEEVSRQSKRGDTPLAARIEKLIQSVREAAEEKHIRFTQGGVQEVPDIPNKHGHFELVVGPFSLDSGQAQVAMWRSKVTRLTFVWIGTNSLLLEGALTLATEVFDHSGAPHALEHLVFHGSHKYPHKGTLHSLSASGLGQASTATTALTYTSYHMESVTAEGFLRTLPVYLEHVFFPTLSPLAFTTEIHHIDKDGKDAGTVYSEMQGYENSAEDLIQRCIRRELFPEHSAYRSTTGGLLDGLRTLDIKKIQDYHTAYYHPQNLQVCVTGHMDPKAVLSVLQEKVEPRLIEEGRALPQKNWKRPFLETASQGGPRLTNTRSVEIEFPAVDEVSGVVLISWVGAPVTDDLRTEAQGFLLSYLTSPRDSPLARSLQESNTPQVSEITFFRTEAERNIWSISLKSVVQSQMGTISEIVQRTIAQEIGCINMKKLSREIEQKSLQIIRTLEVNPAIRLMSQARTNHLYGDDHHLETSMSESLKRFKELANWSQPQWSAELKRCFVDSPSLRIIAKPSTELAKRIRFDEKQRAAAVKKTYRPEDLKQFGHQLLKAQKLSNQPIPHEVISKFPLSIPEDIKFPDIEIARGDLSLNTELQRSIDARDPNFIPMFVQFHNVKSQSVSIDINLVPKNFPFDLLPLLQIYFLSFFSLPIKRDDSSVLMFNQAVQLLHEVTFYHLIKVNARASQTLEISVKFEASNYEKVISLLSDLLWGSIFDVERLKIIINQAIKSLSDKKSIPSATCTALYQDMLLSTGSLCKAFNHINMERTLSTFLHRLETESTSVVKALESLRSHLLKPENFKIGIFANIKNLHKPKTTWLEKFFKIQRTSNLSLREELLEGYWNYFFNPENSNPVDTLPAQNILSEFGAHPSGKLLIVGLPTSQSSYAYYYTRVLRGVGGSESSALCVAVKILSMYEGVLHKKIRHVAYVHQISHYYETGIIELKIFDAPDAWNAFHEAQVIFKDFMNIKEDDLKTAKNLIKTLCYESQLIQVSAADLVFTNTAVLGLPEGSWRDFLDGIERVTLHEVVEAIRKYVVKLFDPKCSGGIVGAPSESVEHTCSLFQRAGYNVELKELE